VQEPPVAMSVGQAAAIIQAEGTVLTVLWREDKGGAKRHGIKALTTDTEQKLLQRMFDKKAFDIQNAILVDEVNFEFQEAFSLTPIACVTGLPTASR